MITAMCIVIAAGVRLFCVIAGLGQFVRKAFGLQSVSFAGWFAAFWIGYAVVIGALELWNLVLPLDWRVCVTLGIPGAIGFVWGVVSSLRSRRISISRARLITYIFVFTVTLAPVAIWVANRALDAQVDFDTTMYHLGTIRWANEYAVVAGGGKLPLHAGFYSFLFFFFVALGFA